MSLLLWRLTTCVAVLLNLRLDVSLGNKQNKESRPLHLTLMIKSPVVLGRDVLLQAESNLSLDTSRRWSRCEWGKCDQQHDELLFNGAHFHDDRTKFTELVGSNSFTLVIRSLTKDDVNKTYQLMFSFNVIYAVNVTLPNNFHGEGPESTRASKIPMIIGLTFGSAVVIGVIMLIVVCKRRQSRRHAFTRNPAKCPEEGIVMISKDPTTSIVNSDEVT